MDPVNNQVFDKKDEEINELKMQLVAKEKAVTTETEASDLRAKADTIHWDAAQLKTAVEHLEELMVHKKGEGGTDKNKDN